jgi:5-formyltetrahydrofolate cyclo-ligase
MNFFNWSKNEPLEINKYGIPEPISDNVVYPDILLIPLSAFDKRLYRAWLWWRLLLQVY